MYNKQNIIPVPVIASFDTEGRVMPLYFRYKEHGSIPVTMKTQVKYITYIQFTYEWGERKWYIKRFYQTIQKWFQM